MAGEGSEQVVDGFAFGLVPGQFFSVPFACLVPSPLSLVGIGSLPSVSLFLSRLRSLFLLVHMRHLTFSCFASAPLLLLAWLSSLYLLHYRFALHASVTYPSLSFLLPPLFPGPLFASSIPTIIVLIRSLLIAVLSHASTSIPPLTYRIPTQQSRPTRNELGVGGDRQTSPGLCTAALPFGHAGAAIPNSVPFFPIVTTTTSSLLDN